MEVKNYERDKPRRITTALLMAAGMGTRIRPLSEDTPKPLISVRGTPMIETNIKALKLAGIEEIYITVGYKKEKYLYLKDKYEGIQFIENKEYKFKNTISSFYAAIEYIKGKNCIISESDLYIGDPNLLNKETSQSRYMIQYTENQDYEWGFHIENDKIKKIVRPTPGTFLNHRMYGIAYWLKDDLDKLIKEVEKFYDDVTYSQKAYDEMANGLFDKINMGYFEVRYGEIYEVDTLSELVVLDKSYSKYLRGE